MCFSPPQDIFAYCLAFHYASLGAHHILSLLGCLKAKACLKWLKVAIGLLTNASLLSFLGDESSGGGVRISCSGDPSGKTPGTASTIAEEAVDQLQENEKLVAGRASDNATQVSGDIRMFLSDSVKSGHKLNVQISKIKAVWVLFMSWWLTD